MKPTIKKRIDDIFNAEGSSTIFEQYLPSLRSNLESAELKAQKLLKAILILAVVFELLRHAAISEFSFAGMKFSDLSLIRKVIPIGIGYLSYQCIAMFTMRRLYREAHDVIIRKTHELFYQNDLEMLFHSPSAMLAEKVITAGSSSWIGKAVDNLTFPLKIAILFAPIAFGAWSFTVLIREFGFGDVVIWGSLFVSLPFYVQGILIFWDTDKLTG
ncbi:MAG: hypothetical protein ACXAB2_14175 [Candidatus Hodarchaeales archaeon]|jgi:hypothetical protein